MNVRLTSWRVRVHFAEHIFAAIQNVIHAEFDGKKKEK